MIIILLTLLNNFPKDTPAFCKTRVSRTVPSPILKLILTLGDGHLKSSGDRIKNSWIILD